MKILLIGSFKYGMYAPAFSQGFRKLGHEVLEIDYEHYHLKGENILSTFHNRFQDRYHFGLQLRKYNKAIIEAVEQESPDMVFLYRCYHVYESTLQKIKSKSVIMSYNNDDPFSKIPSQSYFRYHIKNAYCCDINYVYRKKNIEDYKKIGVLNTKVLLPYYLSWQNKPLECEKDIPIAFIGHYEDDGRDAVIKSLIDEGLPVQLYGGGLWKRSPLFPELKKIYHGSVTGDDYNRLLNRVSILLVFYSKHNHDTYTRRCFEIPAAKGLMLSEYTDDMNFLFPENECAVYFRSAKDFIEKAKWLLSNPKEIGRIANNGYERLLQLGATEIDRCSEIIEDYTLINK